jgi:hypothetical protein
MGFRGIIIVAVDVSPISVASIGPCEISPH